jgi:hypothetical protein
MPPTGRKTWDPATMFAMCLRHGIGTRPYTSELLLFVGGDSDMGLAVHRFLASNAARLTKQKRSLDTFTSSASL